MQLKPVVEGRQGDWVVFFQDHAMKVTGRENGVSPESGGLSVTHPAWVGSGFSEPPSSTWMNERIWEYRNAFPSNLMVGL